MVLLILEIVLDILPASVPLNSTMVLLISENAQSEINAAIFFKFHYGSINIMTR